MDCCNFPEYRAPYWGDCGYAPALGYAPHASAASYYSPYATYAPDYSAQEQYARYAAAAAAYRYQEYPAHHAAPLDRDRALLEYGGGSVGVYPAKESRRRAAGRRDTERARARTPAAHHLQLPHTPTPPLDSSMMGRVPAAYCDPHLSWPHYHNGSGGAGWGGAPAWAGVHQLRNPLTHLAAMHDHCGPRNHKGHISMMEQMGTSQTVGAGSGGGRPAGGGGNVRSFSYEEGCAAGYAGRGLAPEYVDYTAAARRAATPPAPAPAPVPLPAFQQAFGSTEIGKFAEAFSRAEAAHEADALESFPDWEPPDPAWPPTRRPPAASATY